MRRLSGLRSSGHARRSIGQLAIGVFLVVLGFAMAGCVVTFPSSQQQRMPNPMPSMPGSGSPQSTPAPSLPSPSLPSPSLPSPSLPSPSLPSAGAPSSSLPSASQPSGGGAAGGNPSVIPPSGGGPQQGGGGGGPQQGGGGGGLDLPSGGDGGNEAGSPDIGWEVSNDTGDEPGAAGGRAGEQGTENESGQPTGENAAVAETEGTGDAGESQVDALERALGELDGEILDERVATGGPQSGPGKVASDPQGNAAPAPPRAEPEMAQTPSAPLPPDRPDARDDDVVARQLREAAMAETDPELREQLWEEYRRYKAGL